MIFDCPPSHYEWQIKDLAGVTNLNRVEGALSAFKNAFSLDAALLSPLCNGANQSTYLVEFKNETFVVKLLDKESSLSDILLIFHAYQKAAELGVGPSILHLDITNRALVMDYIKPADAPPDPKIALSLLKIFHRRIDNEPFSTIKQRIEEIGIKDPDYIHLFDEASERISRIEQAVGPPTAYCHFDFHKNNIVMGAKGVFLIDFDDAGPGHPFYDLAKIYLYESNENKQDILEHYLGRAPKKEDYALLFLMEQTAYLSSATNRLLRWIKTGKQNDSLYKEAMASYASFLENTNHEEFELNLKTCFVQRLQ